MKYVRVADGLNSNAGNFQFKLNAVNVAEKWDPKETEPEKMGGFNFSTEDKILRWLHRGTVIYDVVIPEDAEVVECDSPNCPGGVFRTNKIILENPRQITDELAIELYKKSDLPERSYYQCICVLLFKKRLEAARYIVSDRITKNNVNDAIAEFESFIMPNGFNEKQLWSEAREIYKMLSRTRDEK